MRRILMAMLVLALAPAGATAAPCMVGDDPAGDPGSEMAFLPSLPRAQGEEDRAVDILAIAFATGSEDLEVTLTVEDVDARLGEDVDVVHHYVAWRIGERYPNDYYLVEAERRGSTWSFGWAHDFPPTVGIGPTSRPVRVNTYDPDTQPIDGSVDAGANTIAFSLPLEVLGNPPGGTVLRRISAQAFARGLVAPPTVVNDEIWWTFLSDYAPDNPDADEQARFTYTLGTTC